MPYLREPNWSIFSNASIVLFTVATPSSPNWLPMNDENVIFLALITFRNYDQRINLVLESLSKRKGKCHFSYGKELKKLIWE